ncbi:MAG: right-handed parallel beta-helix repeat-containing protein, partial [Chitinophagales bacterium]
TTVCSGTNSGSVTLSDHTGSVVKWQYSSDNFASDEHDIVNTTTTQSYTNLTSTTSYRAVVQSGVCATANSSSATITVNANVTYYQDLDTDGFGNPDVSQVSCSGAPGGYILDNTDCNDASADEHPGQTWYADVDGDGFGDAAIPLVSCLQPDDYVLDDTDCDDGLFMYADNDGDGAGAGDPVACGEISSYDCNDSDPEFQSYIFYADEDGDGFGDAFFALYTCDNMIPDGFVDNTDDCDDDLLLYADADEDGYGSDIFAACAGATVVTNTDDCNDGNNQVYPGAIEVCANSIDDDCDFSIDEGCSGVTRYFVNDNSTAGDIFTTAVGSNANAGTNSAPFATLAFAINTATTNDTLFVDNGAYTEQVQINKSLVIIGSGSTNTTTILAPASPTNVSNANGTYQPIVYVSGVGNNVEIHDIKVDGDGGRNVSNLIGIYYFEASGLIDDCRVTGIHDAPSVNGNQRGQGIFVNHSYDVNLSHTVTISNSKVDDYQKTGILINELGTEGIVINDSIIGSSVSGIIAQNGIQFGYGAWGTIQGNVISNNLYNTVAPHTDVSSGILLAGAGIDFNNTPTGNSIFIGGAGALANTIIGNETGLFTAGGGFGYDSNAGMIYGANNFSDNNIHAQLEDPATVPSASFVYDKRVDNSSITNVVYGCIQYAVDFAANGDDLNAGSGTFIENVTVHKEVNIGGAGQGSTFVIPAISNPVCGGGSLCGGLASNIFLVQASNVTIHDLTIDGDNPSLNSSVVVDGVDIDARNGIITNHSMGVYQNLEIHDVTLNNIYLRGAYASTGGSFNFHDNTVDNVQGEAASIGMFNFGGTGIFDNNTVSDCNDAIAANNSTGTVFKNNTVTGSASGIHTDNNGSSGGITDTIKNNIVSNSTASGYGIWVFAPYRDVVVKDNTVNNVVVGMALAGQQAAVTPVFMGNTIDGQGNASATGVYVTTSLFGFGSSDVSGVFNNNYIINNADGWYLESEGGQTLTISANNNAIADNSNSNVFDANAGGTLNAGMTCNWWGTTVPGDVGATISGSVSYIPYLKNGTDSQPGSPGFQTNEICNGICLAFTPAISGADTVCAFTTGSIYTTEEGMYDYNWNVSGGIITNVAANVVTVDWDVAGIGIVSVIYTDSTGCTDTSANFEVIIIDAPLPTVAGADTVCAFTTGSAYTTEGGMNNYNWNVSGGVISSVTDSIVYIDWDAAGIGIVSVTYTNDPGCEGASPAFEVTILESPLPTVTGADTVCAFTTGSVYTTESGMTNYNWNISGGVISNVMDSIVYVDWDAAGIGIVSVTYTNEAGCEGTSPDFELIILESPQPTLSGSDTVCAFTTASIYTTESGMTNYNWNVSGGVISNVTDSIVYVDWDAPGIGIVSVTYTNDLGCEGTSANFEVIILDVPLPIVTGTDTVCAFSEDVAYITQGGMSGYDWGVSGGVISSVADNIVSINWDDAGLGTVTVTYTAASGCTGTSAPFEVVINPLPTPTVMGNDYVCPNASGVVYNTEPGQSLYTWNVAGGSIASGGTLADDFIVINWGPAGFGTVSVNYSNEFNCTALASTNYDVTIEDTVKPLIICPGNTGIACDESSDSSNTGMATATDNCDSDPSISYTDVIVPGSCIGNYTINRTWKAQDANGNFATCLQVIVVSDVTDPLIGIPAASLTVECDGSGNTGVLNSWVATNGGA